MPGLNIYPVEIIPDEPGYLVKYPDFPFVFSAGDTMEEALREALDGLSSGIGHFFETHLPVPMPSAAKGGQHTLVLPAVTVARFCCTMR
jgi:antitoxin HicB